MARDAATGLHHGGRLLEARRRFPGAPEPFLDLSTGINPIAYPIGTIPPSAYARLPEPEHLAALQHAAATAYGAASPAMVVAAPGTQILISLLPRLLPQTEVAVLSPTYSEHAAVWRAAGARVLEVAEFAALECAGAAVLCNPNNPDGRRIAPGDVLALADRLARRGGLLVVDEAFADFEDGLGVAPHLPHPALLVLRSFGKAYGLAGLRLGFALAVESTAARIRDAIGPWAVSGPALALGRRALLDRAWCANAASRLQADAAALDRCIVRAGLRVVGGTRLFRLAEGPAAPDVFVRLGRHGILVREFPARPHWLRFGIPGQPEAWDRLHTAIKAV